MRISRSKWRRMSGEKREEEEAREKGKNGRSNRRRGKRDIFSQALRDALEALNQNESHIYIQRNTVSADTYEGKLIKYKSS